MLSSMVCAAGPPDLAQRRQTPSSSAPPQFGQTDISRAHSDGAKPALESGLFFSQRTDDRQNQLLALISLDDHYDPQHKKGQPDQRADENHQRSGYGRYE